MVDVELEPVPVDATLTFQEERKLTAVKTSTGAAQVRFFLEFLPGA